jgi:hypothetical protein
MSLDSFFAEDKQAIKEKIKQRRAQMLIHSCIYYELDSNIVSDHKWQEWAEELDQLQKDNPDCLNLGFYDKNFLDWDGTTGAHLPHRNRWVYNKALNLLRKHEEPNE